jgi:hypothetical protein
LFPVLKVLGLNPNGITLQNPQETDIQSLVDSLFLERTIFALLRHLLSLPKSRFSDSRRAFVVSIIAFIALVASFSLKNLPISEKCLYLCR